MGKAYTAVMQQAGNDSEMRAMLVRSQKRWLAARDKRFADPVDFPGAPNAKALRASLLQAIRQRTETLSERGRPRRACLKRPLRSAPF